MKKVDICECNFVLGTEKVKDELEKSNDFEVEVHGCLGHCGECYDFHLQIQQILAHLRHLLYVHSHLKFLFRYRYSSY